jgi:methylglutaconyl-CoA hydratase
MTEMTLETQWKSASWANQKGLFAQIFDTTTQLDAEITAFANKLAGYNSESLIEIKKIFWEGTENWNTLLYERAEISGKLVLSDFSRKALNQFKK